MYMLQAGGREYRGSRRQKISLQTPWAGGQQPLATITLSPADAYAAQQQASILAAPCQPYEVWARRPSHPARLTELLAVYPTYLCPTPPPSTPSPPSTLPSLPSYTSAGLASSPLQRIHHIS